MFNQIKLYVFILSRVIVSNSSVIPYTVIVPDVALVL